MTAAGLALLAAGAGVALAGATPRLELSLAKHRSLAGHARLARRVASLIPRYEFDGERFFRSDGAPAAVVARRK